MNPAWQLTVLLVAAVLLLLHAFIMWRLQSGVKALNSFALLLVFAAGWSAVTAVDLVTHSLSQKVFLFQFRFLFIPFMGPLVLETVHRFTLGRGFFTGWKLAAGLVIPVITVALTEYPGVHPFFRSHFQVHDNGSFPILTWTNGPWALLYLFFSFSLEVWSLLLLLHLVRHSRGKALVTNLCLTFFFLAPSLSDWAFALGISPTPGFNYTPLVFSAVGIILGWSAIRYRYFDLVPVARAQLVEHLKEMLIVMDGEGRVVDLNGATSHALAVQAEKVIGKKAEMLLAPWPKVVALLPMRSVSGRDVEIKVRGKLLIHECSILSVPAEAENPRSRILLLRDITERKHMEAELQRAKEKAEASDEAKGRFLAMMSHEIRTPMNGVLGFAEMLQKTPLNADQQEYVNLISHSSELLLVVINDILDYSKIEAGRIELDARSFDLPGEVEKIHRLLSPQARERNLDFRWGIDPEVPPKLWGDSVRLGQILTNLLANALKFTSAGEVVLHIRRLPDAEKDSRSRHQIVFEVRDTGIGMSPETIARLFQPFSQADSSTSRRFGGTGLGLAISQRLSGLMGGHIAVQSEPGRGSIFTCTLSLRSATPQETAVALRKRSISGPLPGGSLRVLVVEDNPINQRVAGALLQRMGHTAAFANEGEECLKILATQSYDAVLMDIEMPGMDGFETVRRLRRREREFGKPPIRIIALTAHALAENRDRCLAAGMDQFLTKPINSAQLKAMLSE